jgi:hypothetical protein
MKRIIISAISFAIFLIEFIVQLGYIVLDMIRNIYISFLYSIVRYHNRVQMFTTKTNYVRIEEVKT